MKVVVNYTTKIKEGKVKKIKFYEWDFICQILNHLYEAKEDENFSLIGSYNIEKCKQCNLASLALGYFNNLDFSYPVVINQIIDGKSITLRWDKERVLKDKDRFYNLLDWWLYELFEAPKTDRFIHEARIEYKEKIKQLNRTRVEQLINKFRFERRVLEWQLIMFYICYLGRKHFSSGPQNYKQFEYNEMIFVFNEYSWVHIYSRHYFPNHNNFSLGKSMIGDAEFIDAHNLSDSLIKIIKTYFDKNTKSLFNNEYIIFSYKTTDYILHVKLKKCQEVKFLEAYEIRTFYPIKLSLDKEKISKAKSLVIEGDWKYYFFD